MIKISHIVPNCLNTLTEKYSDLHLLLLHWAMKSPEYLQFFVNSKSYKILDNSFYELQTAANVPDLLHYAEKLKVDEVVAPDVMYDRETTIKLTELFIKQNAGRFKVQAVVCGKEYEDLIDCFHYFNEHSRIDVIAISKHGFKVPGKSFLQCRQEFLQSIEYFSKKPIHLLGINSISELYYPYSSYVRSIDSKFMAKLAHGDKIDLHTKLNDSSKKLFNKLCMRFKKMEGK